MSTLAKKKILWKEWLVQVLLCTKVNTVILHTRHKKNPPTHIQQPICGNVSVSDMKWAKGSFQNIVVIFEQKQGYVHI
jgi:hypothetical protein